MPKARSLHAAIGFLGLLTGCAATTPPVLTPAQSVAIRDSVRAALGGYIERMNHHDIDSLLRFYVDDERFNWVADGRLIPSLTDIRKGIEAVSGFSRWHLEYTDTRIVALAPGVASVSTLYTQSLADSTGKGFSFGGALTMNFIDTPGGWKLLDGHSSSAQPPHN
jgi:hypothetical protein